MPPKAQTASMPGPSRARQDQENNSVLKNRNPSACIECRRRKQKCSLGHPCTNCARRFPQPPCVYGVEKAKRPSWKPSSPPGSRDRGGSGFYSHLDMESIHDAILDVEGRLDLGIPVDHFSGIQPNALPSTYRAEYRERPVFLMQNESWAGGKPFALRFRDKSGLLKDRTLLELLQFILRTRLQVANRIIHDELEIDGRQLMQAALNAPSRDLSCFDDQMQRLPMQPTKMNKELVRTHLQLLSRFKVSLDGSPRPQNRFMRHWIPFSTQDRLVLHVMLCTTASFLHETGRLPKTLLYMHRGNVTRMLNEHLASAELCVGDSAMLAVNQLILTSWYWSSTAELHAHMRGFRRMIELRGGCQELGLEGYVAKVALLNDAVIAMCHDTEPVFFGHAGFEFEDPIRVPLQINFNSPFLLDNPPFRIPSSLRLHRHTAEILDHTRDLFRAVFDALTPGADEAQLRAVSESATSLLCLIDRLPDQVPLPSSRDEDYKNKTRSLSDDDDDDDVSTGHKRKRDDDDNDARLQARSDDPPDMVHRCVRLTAGIWAKAVLGRVPTRAVCTEADFVQIWSSSWAAGLNRWSSLSGVYAWLSIAIAPLCHTTVHARMVKTLAVAAFTHMGTENWHVAAGVATAALSIQAWLRAGRKTKPAGAVSAACGGEKAIDDFGFAFKENMPDLPDHRNEAEQPGLHVHGDDQDG